MKKTKIEYLSESLKRRLQKVLDLAPDKERVLTLTELEGFLHALAITPDFVSMNEWIPAIFDGEDPVFDSEEQMREFVETLLSAYNVYQRAYNSGKLKFPFNLEKLDQEMFQEIIQWCYGFLEAVAMREELWTLPSEDPDGLSEEAKDFITSLFLVFAFGDPIEFIHLQKQEGLTDNEIEEKMTKMLIALPEAIDILQEYAKTLWGQKVEGMKKGIFDFNTRRKKVGRNEPCPCGSGKKYKKCCGKN